eukprot:scaffold100940_cov76-Cyclotella_meneghiniana.AAC.1
MKVIHLFLLLIGLTDGFAPVKPSAAHKPKLFTSSAACWTPASSIIHKSTTQLSALPLLTEESSQKLVLLTFEKAIEAGVPALFFVVGALLVVKAVKGDDRSNKSKRNKRKSNRGNQEPLVPLGPIEQLYDDIYDDLSSPSQVSPFQKLLAMGSASNKDFDKPTSKLNIGIPREYLKITKLNSKYDSYRYSMIKATKGKAAAATEIREKSFENALGKALGISSSSQLQLTLAEGTQLLELEKNFLKEGSELLAEVAELSREITNDAVLEEMESMGVEAGDIDSKVNDTVVDAVIEGKTTMNGENATTGEKKDSNSKKKTMQGDIMKAVKELEGINTQILLLEIDFIQSIVEVLGPNRADAIRTTLVGNMINGEAGTLLKSLKERPLAAVFSSFFNNEVGRKNLYVMNFPGDVTASQLNELREEVTGVLRAAQPNDEVLLVLQSGGGTVTGYGLAAGQLQRIKQKGLKLTICVEQVAASGGYSELFDL